MVSSMPLKGKLFPGIINSIYLSILSLAQSKTSSPLASAPAPVISGNGTLNIIFWPAFGDGNGNPIKGLTAIISGSWRDW